MKLSSTNFKTYGLGLLLGIIALILACDNVNPGKPTIERDRRNGRVGNDNGLGQQNNGQNTGDQQNNEGAGAADGQAFTFSWQPGDNQVYEYELHIGTDRENLQLYKSYRDDKSPNRSFDITNPSVSISTEELNWQEGQNLCFQVIAINIQGPSPASDITCLNDG